MTLRNLLFAMALTLSALAFSAAAATRVWNGNVNGNWTTAGNWNGGVAPQPGDTLEFPAGATRFTITNNYAANTEFNIVAIYGAGYSIYGNSLRLRGDNGVGQAMFISMPNGNCTWRPNISLTGTNQNIYFVTVGAGAGLVLIEGDIAMGNHDLLLQVEAHDIDLRGAISSSGADNWVSVIGGGDVIFSGATANTFSGGVNVQSSRLYMNKTAANGAIPNDLTLVGTVSDMATLYWMRPQQIANNAHLLFGNYANGFLNGFAESIDDLGLHRSTLDLGGGLLALLGDMQGAESQILDGELQLSLSTHEFRITAPMSIAADISGVAAIEKTEVGALTLSGSNTFTGYLFINAGSVIASSTNAFGLPSGLTTVSNGASVVLTEGITIGLEPLLLSGLGVASNGTLRAQGNSEWRGDIQVLTNASIWVTNNKSLTLRGSISSTNEIRKIGNGTLVFAGSTDNALTGRTLVEDGTLRLAKTGGAEAVAGELRLHNDFDGEVETVVLDGPNQIADSALVILSENTLWNLNGFNETIGRLASAFASDSGEVALGIGTLTIQADANTSSFPGIISGSGGITKRGSQPLYLSGDNTYTGSTLVQNGTLYVEGDQPASPVTVLTGATLSGDGTVGRLQNNAGGTVWLFASFDQPLTTSNLVLNAGSTLRLNIADNGTNDFLNVRGSVALNSSTLALNIGYVPAVGDTFTLIQNDGVDFVAGTFAGFPNGPFTGPGGLTWNMTYANDVTLELVSQGVNPAPASGSNYLDVIVLGGNGNGHIDHNECVQLLLPLYNDTDTARPEFNVFLSSPVPGLLFHQPFAHYPALAPGTGAYNLTPFQISTPTNFPCGTNLPIIATIRTGTNAPFNVQLVLPTGRPGAEMRFDSADVPQAVADGGRITNTIPVNSFTGFLARVEVSLNIPHELASDVEATLIAPNGTAIPLTASFGSGPNYGNGCADGQRTRFSMAATQFIGDASAPFAGTFRPAGNLNALRGLFGEDVEGKWNLRVSDNAHLNLGSLACWSLYLYPATCTDGGGVCETCPGAIVGQLGDGDPLASGVAVPTVEYAPTQCGMTIPVAAQAATVPFDRYAFTNLGSSPTCVTVTLSSECTGLGSLWSSSYSNQFLPGNVTSNLLGTIGASPDNWLPTRSYSFTVPASNRFEVIVSGYYGQEGCKSYTLQVESPNICPVLLRLTALSPNSMRLDWPNYAIGYELETRNTFSGGGTWTPLPQSPVVTAGRYTVTNQVSESTGFYRLIKD